MTYFIGRKVIENYLIQSCVLAFFLLGPVGHPFLLSQESRGAGEAADASLLTLERIFSSEEFESEKFGPVRWLEDGSGYTTLEDSDTQESGKDIVRYDPETGSREIMVPSTRLIPPGESAPLEIDRYCWSPDGRKLLVLRIPNAFGGKTPGEITGCSI